MALLVAAFGCGAMPRAANAQVNAETLRVALRDNPTFLWLDGSLETRAGNSQGATLAASAFGGVTRPPHLFFGKAAADYATTKENTLIVARSLLHIRYNYETTPFLYLEVLAQVQHDHFRRLAVRDLYGTGLRFNIVRTDPFEVFAGSTIILEQQVISPLAPYAGQSDLWARSSNYAGINAALATFVELNMVTYVQPRLDRPKDFRVLHETIVTLAITKRLAAKISANVTYDREPPGGVLPADLQLKNSLAVKF
jgi:Protein of unknown function, DUF481